MKIVWQSVSCRTSYKRSFPDWCYGAADGGSGLQAHNLLTPPFLLLLSSASYSCPLLGWGRFINVKSLAGGLQIQSGPSPNPKEHLSPLTWDIRLPVRCHGDFLLFLLFLHEIPSLTTREHYCNTRAHLYRGAGPYFLPSRTSIFLLLSPLLHSSREITTWLWAFSCSRFFFHPLCGIRLTRKLTSIGIKQRYSRTLPFCHKFHCHN